MNQSLDAFVYVNHYGMSKQFPRYAQNIGR